MMASGVPLGGEMDLLWTVLPSNDPVLTAVEHAKKHQLPTLWRVL